MSIWGTIIGGAAGLALGGPLGALLGASAGHVVHRAIRGGEGDTATEKITFTIGVIALSAKMAKADGQVTSDEVDAFRQVFDVPPHELRNVERVYDLAKQDTAGFEAYAKQIANLFEDSHIVLEDLLDALFHIAKADGVVHPEELAYIRTVAEIFGFTEAEFEVIAARQIGPDKSSPFTILGVSPDIDDDELKQVYRRLIRENHPDKLVAAGVPKEFINIANDRLASINAAYERIANQRGL